jgi:thiol-disulfide isomerase/thioredoxin
MSKTLILLLAVTLFGFVPNSHAMQPLSDNDKPVIARFTADWCGNCKILEPKLQQALDETNLRDAFNIVIFDFTNDQSEAEAAAKAGETGLTDLYQKHAPKTGFAILIKNGQEVARLTKSNSVEDIKTKLMSLTGTNE